MRDGLARAAAEGMLAGFAMAATQAGLGLNANVVIAAVLLFASSAAFALFNITAVTMRQRRVPAELLGRVTSLYGTVTRGCEAMGAIAGGMLAAYNGLRPQSRPPAPPAPARSPRRRPLPGADQPPACPRWPHRRIRAGRLRAYVKASGTVLEPHRGNPVQPSARQ